MKKVVSISGILIFVLFFLFCSVGCSKKTDLAWRDNSTYYLVGQNYYKIAVINQTNNTIENVTITVYYGYKTALVEPEIETSKEFVVKKIETNEYAISFPSGTYFSASKIKKVTFSYENGNIIVMDKLK